MTSLARRNLLHDRARLVVTLTGIVFAVVLSAVQLGLFVGFQRATSDLIRYAGADLWVRRGFVTAGAFGDQRFPGTIVRIGQRLGRKTIHTDDPAERTDTKVLETLLALDPGARLPIGLRVDGYITR